MHISSIQAKHFKTNNILLTMGSDFHYMNAPMWFKNLDKLIKYVREVRDWCFIGLPGYESVLGTW